MERRADVYRQQVTKLSTQLEKQLVGGAERLDKVEAALNARSGGGESDTETTLVQLSKRLAVMERGMNQLYAKMFVSFEGNTVSQGTQGEERGSAFSGRLFTDSVGEGKLFGGVHEHDRSPYLRSADMESLVKSIVQAEVKKLTGDFKAYMQEYDQVFSLFLPPDKDSDPHGEDGLAFNKKGTGRRDKLIPDDVQGDQVIQGDAGDGGVDGVLQEIQSNVDKAGGKISKEVAEYIQNVTDNATQTSTSVPATTPSSRVALSEDFVTANASNTYLLNDDLSDFNDSFSGENSDVNATEVPQSKDAEDFDVGFNRIGKSDKVVEPSTDSHNSILKTTEDTLQRQDSDDTTVSGWMRDEVDRQSQMEERFKSEIRAMLLQPLAKIVSLVEKQAASLRNEIQLQNKRTEESLGEVNNRLDKLDSRAEAVELRVDSLSGGFQDSQGKLGRVKELEVAVHELKKNLSKSMIFLNDAAAAETSREEARILDKHGKHLQKLGRLMNLFNNTLEHYSNETARRFKELEPELEGKIAKIQEEIKSGSENIQASLGKAISRVNETLDRNTLRITEMEESIANQQIDSRVWNNENDRHRIKAENDLKDLRNSFDRLRGRHRDLSKKFKGLDGAQKNLAESLSETNIRISDLQIDLRLRLSKEWVPLRFQYDVSRTACFGEQYVRRVENQTEVRYVGVMLCDSHRYKIFLSKSLEAKFLNIGDSIGMGEDHCEFVGGKENEKVKVSKLNTTSYDTVEGKMGNFLPVYVCIFHLYF